MSAPDPAAVESLAEVIYQASDEWDESGVFWSDQYGRAKREAHQQARAILTSDWLADLLAAAHTERAPEPDGLREAVEAEWFNGNISEGVRDRLLAAPGWTNAGNRGVHPIAPPASPHPAPEPQQAEADRAGGDNWNPITATPACDWCGECEWCDSLHATPPADDASEGLSEGERTALRQAFLGVERIVAARVAAARAEERRAVVEEIAQAIEAERDLWRSEVNRRALDAGAAIAREAGTR